MEYISSDTNVWLDFATIDRLELPFLLPYIYLMDSEAIEDELLNPPDIGEKLVNQGLQATELTEEEFYLAEELSGKYAKPSIYDCIALAIAKKKNIVLLTGDGPLRKAAKAEGVQVMGTIGILDQLIDGNHINLEDFQCCIKELLKHNGKKVRLPEKELKKRLAKRQQTEYIADMRKE